MHTYVRYKTINVFRCDNCDVEFKREHAKMSPKRLSNTYFHVCSKCDAKKFAQKKGVERRKVWDMPASSMLPISKI